MINYQQIKSDLSNNGFSELVKPLIKAVKGKLTEYTHGEYEQWQELINTLPDINCTHHNLVDSIIIGTSEELTKSIGQQAEAGFIEQLKILHPWRKGPFKLFGINIDTEWRSDWKWQRLLPHISPLKNRKVLDVGCGNGYHCWRMLGEQASLVIGIDPSQKFLAQFSVIKKYLPKSPLHLLPIGIEDMPETSEVAGKQSFDTVFSMGVLYHRRSPIDHLIQLNKQLNSKGELVLETLVIEGDQNQVLLPKGRYAQMRNVWFIPSTEALELWLARAGFNNIRTVDINQTSPLEQRATDWMTFQSLADYLDPNDANKTIEGYPAPQRATVIANKA